MASFSRLPSGLWRAQVARSGVRKSASFPTKSAAQQWAAGIESDLMAAKRGELPRKTVGDALTKYELEVSPTKRGARWEVLRLKSFKKEPWAKKWLTDLHAPDLAKWRDRRLQGVTAGSVQRDVNLLHAVCVRARKEWKWIDHDPFEGFVSPGDNRARVRRVTWQEVRAVCRALGYPGPSKSAEVAHAFLIGLRTAMRQGEILGLTPANVDLTTRVAHLAMTKNGDSRDVPLTRAAVRLFRGWRGWTITSASADTLFRRARDECGIVDLHFHDSRAEALTRLSRKVEALTLARISGHRDLKILLDRYYRETAAQIAQRLG